MHQHGTGRLTTQGHQWNIYKYRQTDQDGEHFLMFILSVFYFCPGRAGPGRARPKKAPKLTKTGVPKSGFFSAETRVAEMAGRAGPGRAGSGRDDSIFRTHSQQRARAPREPLAPGALLPTLLLAHCSRPTVAHFGLLPFHSQSPPLSSY